MAVKNVILWIKDSEWGIHPNNAEGLRKPLNLLIESPDQGDSHKGISRTGAAKDQIR